MATLVAPPAAGGGVRGHEEPSTQAEQQAGSKDSPPPVLFLYNHLHDAIRGELDALASTVLELDSAGDGAEGGEADAVLLRLKDRCRFLEQVYKYHSAVEDEVVYPALDAKVKNVTSGYSVEHQDEEYLFEQLGQLLGEALAARDAAARAATVRALVCKVEAIATTLRKHLAKEEAQLLPLLLAHFSYPEQAELVAQFLYCIPLDTVGRVVAWLRPAVPSRELRQLLDYLRDVVPDNLLLELLVTWLDPTAAAAAAVDGGAAGGPAAAPAAGSDLAAAVGGPAEAGGTAAAADGAAAVLSTAAAAPSPAAQQWPPLKGIFLFHASIKGALEAFATEAAALQAAPGGVSASQLAGLVERHRFLRSVCAFHTHSEEEVMFPEVLRLSRETRPAASAAAHSACSACQREHAEEVSLFEELGRLLADVRALARRGRREAGGMLGQLVDASRRVCSAISNHIRREESEVLPLLAAALPPERQRAMVWRTLRAMPLRLLERVMPWLVAKLSPADAEGLICSLRLAAPEADRQVVELLLRWAERGRWGGGDVAVGAGAATAGGGDVSECSGSASGSGEDGFGCGQQAGSDDPSMFVNDTCGLRGVSADGAAAGADGVAPAPRKRARVSSGDGSALPAQREGSGEMQQQPQQQPQEQQQKQHPKPRWLEQHQDGCDCDVAAAADALGKEHHHHQQQQQQPSATCATQPGSHQAAAAQQQLDNHQQQPPQQQQQQQHAAAGPPSPAHSPGAAAHLGGVKQRQAGCGVSPIDHIFQFHKALRQELRQLESDAAELEAAVFRDPASPPPDGGPAASPVAGSGALAPGAPFRRRYAAALQQLSGRFHFLWGIYRAHSRSEDEIVFPALESKEALHNVSHAYTLDHAQEENLFTGLAEVISRMQAGLAAGAAPAAAAAGEPPAGAAAATAAAPAQDGGVAEARELVLQLRRMCAAVRASLETHVRAEEAELWPLFAEHFTFEEQQHLVGLIIGRTGAEVLQALLPWVTGSFSEEEAGAMMESLRAATKNTSFDQWLDATMAGASAGGAAPPPAGGAQQQQTAAADRQAREMESSLAEIAEYLVAPGAAGATEGPSSSNAATAGGSGAGPQQQPQGCVGCGGAGAGGQQQQEASGTVAESSSFRPGWEEIFDINQKQLEAAIRRVSNDPSLEPQRKAYLIQNIMVSRYIVAQQRRMRALGTPGGTPQVAPQQPGAVPPAPGLALPPGPGSQPADTTPQQQQPQQQEGEAAGAEAPAEGAAGAAAQSRPAPSYHDAAAGVLGCRHYRRRAQLVAPCCNKAFTCRLCHDDASDHRMDRYAVAEMVCMECGTRQPVAGACRTCAAPMARYYCSICHLFDDEPGRSIYHCPFCNVCRRGQGLGVDFFHCMNCNACMSLSLFNQHTCRERAMEGNCPVCHEYLFDSHAPIKELPCGHFLHSSCFAQYTRYNYTCPVCFKSIGDMSVYFKMIDSLLAAEAARMPPQYAGRTQAVLCHDCGRQGLASWHFVYHSCQHCRSYNTRVL